MGTYDLDTCQILEGMFLFSILIKVKIPYLPFFLLISEFLQGLEWHKLVVTDIEDDICSRKTDFYNGTKKRQHYFDILKAFFVRHSSEYKTSDSDRKVNRNIYPDAVARDGIRLIDPKSGQLGPIHHCLLEEC